MEQDRKGMSPDGERCATCSAHEIYQLRMMGAETLCKKCFDTESGEKLEESPVIGATPFPEPFPMTEHTRTVENRLRNELWHDYTQEDVLASKAALSDPIMDQYFLKNPHLKDPRITPGRMILTAPPYTVQRLVKGQPYIAFDPRSLPDIHDDEKTKKFISELNGGKEAPSFVEDPTWTEEDRYLRDRCGEVPYMEGFGDEEHFQDDAGAAKPLMVGICRTGSVVSPSEENILHLQNFVVMNRCYMANRKAETEDDDRPVLPKWGNYHSLVFNGYTGVEPFHAHEADEHRPAQTQLVHLLQDAEREQREVILLIRGISGHSVYPNVYERIHKQFPKLNVRIIYAIQRVYVKHANGCLPPWEIDTPFRLHLTPSVEGSRVHYSRPFLIKSLVDNFNGLNKMQDMARVNGWHKEEYGYRMQFAAQGLEVPND